LNGISSESGRRRGWQLRELEADVVAGRPGLSPQKVRQLRTLAAGKANDVRAICKTLGISWATFYRYVN
jgi:hypothetical protein